MPNPLIHPLAKFITQLRTGINIDDISPVNDIGKISPRPVYIVQSAGDTVAPPDLGEKLFEVAGEPRYLWVEEDASHLQTFLDNPRSYKRRPLDFFEIWLLQK